MNKNEYIIRLERKEDYHEVEGLVRDAFWNVYRPGCLEHFVLNQMRAFPDFIKELSFVMEKDGKIIGQNVFVKTVIKGDNGKDLPIATMGPICIAPEFKRQGYGKKLLDYSLDKAKSFGIKAVCFEGNIDFYGKSGFDYANKFNIRYHDVPEDVDTSFFLCKELCSGYLDGVSGEYCPPDCYFVDEVLAEEFDKAFPKKEKLTLDSQIFK